MTFIHTDAAGGGYNVQSDVHRLHGQPAAAHLHRLVSGYGRQRYVRSNHIYKMLFFAVVSLFVSMSVYAAYVSTLCAAVMITADFQAGEMFMLGRGDPFLDFELPVDVVVADMHNAFVAITINVRVVGNLLPG